MVIRTDRFPSELQNVDVAKNNLDIAMKSYEWGGISDLEVREAQVAFVEAEGRLLNAQFAAKAAEVELFRLTGGLRVRE